MKINNILDPEEMLMRELTILLIGNVIDLGTQAVEDNNPFYFDYRDLVGGMAFPEGGDTTRLLTGVVIEGLPWFAFSALISYSTCPFLEPDRVVLTFLFSSFYFLFLTLLYNFSSWDSRLIMATCFSGGPFPNW